MRIIDMRRTEKGDTFGLPDNQDPGLKSPCLVIQQDSSWPLNIALGSNTIYRYKESTPVVRVHAG